MVEDYWNSRFKAGKVWGSEASGTAFIASEYFKKLKKSDILVIGSGYGRNTNYFYANGFNVEGIEYSKDGVEIARNDNPSIVYYHGSAFDMPLSDKKYSAIYCYNVIHLFMEHDRELLISLCGEVLEEGGVMFFSAFSDEDEDYGLGEELETNTYEIKKNKPVHYYGDMELLEVFKNYRIIEDGTYTEVVGSKECKLRFILVQL